MFHLCVAASGLAEVTFEGGVAKVIARRRREASKILLDDEFKAARLHLVLADDAAGEAFWNDRKASAGADSAAEQTSGFEAEKRFFDMVPAESKGLG